MKKKLLLKKLVKQWLRGDKQFQEMIADSAEIRHKLDMFRIKWGIQSEIVFSMPTDRDTRWGSFGKIDKLFKKK